MKAVLLVALFGAALGLAQTPPSADGILEKAKAEAAPQKRAIFTIFHASW